MLHGRSNQSCAVQPVRVDEIVSLRALTCAHRTAVVEEQRRWTYGELEAAVQKTTVWLAESDVRCGDRLLLVCENSCSAIALYFAATRLGAWPVLVNARLSTREIEEIRVHSGARRTVFALSGSPRARAHADSSGATLHDPADLGPVGLGALNDGAIAEIEEADRAANVAAVIYTTGTTGRPKGVMLTHRNLLFVASTTAEARRLTPSDRMYVVLPISHTLGLSGILLAALLSGAEVHLPARFDPNRALQALAQQGITTMIGTPSMYGMIAEFARRKGSMPITAPALRLISSAGAPLDAATKAGVETAFGQPLHNGYGISECGPSLTLTSLDKARNDCSVGRLLPCIEAKLMDDAATSGELWVRTPGLMKGYYKAPAETAAAVDPEGWFRTGDLARMDEEGNVFITGRAKELIIRFGFNVYPAEIEAVLNEYPAVLRSAVIGRADEGTEGIVAFVELVADTDISIAKLSSHAAERLASYKQPTEIITLAALPVAVNGKILKSELAAMCARLGHGAA